MQSRLPDKSWSSYPKHRFDRRFEPRSQDEVDSLKHGRLAHIRSQFSLFRRSPTHKNLPLATFCTSEQLLFGSFCRSKKNKPVPFRELSDKQKVCPCRGSTLRGFSAACGGYPCCCRNNMFAASRHFFGASGRRPLPRKHAHTGGSSHKQIKTFRKTESFPLPRHILHNKRL